MNNEGKALTVEAVLGGSGGVRRTVRRPVVESLETVAVAMIYFMVEKGQAIVRREDFVKV